MAVMPAFLQFLGTLKGTILADQYKPLYQDWYKNLKPKEKQRFDRSEKKFFCFSKGAKNYDHKSEVLDEVYDALLKEQKLRVSYRSRAGELVEDVLLPLSLVMFNTGLYLVYYYDSSEVDELGERKAYTMKIETIEDADSLRTDGFAYPIGFDPSKLFDGSFGFIRGESGDRTEVVIDFDQNSWVYSWLEERTWSGDETYTLLKSGKVRMRMTVSDLREVLPWIFSLGDQVSVYKPASLKHQVREMALRIADNNK